MAIGADALSPTQSVHRLQLLVLLLLHDDGIDGVLAEAGTPAVDVLAEQRHARKSLAAVLARVFLHVRVGLQMRAQIGTVGERPSAVLARERLLAGVRPDVSLQQPRPRKRLSAQLALARQGVSADVHFEGAQRHVRLLAVLAAERLGWRAVVVVGVVVVGHGRSGRRCGRTVERAVLAEVGEAGVALAARLATVSGAAPGGGLALGRTAEVLDAEDFRAGRRRAGRRQQVQLLVALAGEGGRESGVEAVRRGRAGGGTRWRVRRQGRGWVQSGHWWTADRRRGHRWVVVELVVMRMGVLLVLLLLVLVDVVVSGLVGVVTHGRPAQLFGRGGVEAQRLQHATRGFEVERVRVVQLRGRRRQQRRWRRRRRRADDQRRW